MSESKRRSGLAGSESTVARLMDEAAERQREQESHGRGKPAHSGQLGQDSAGRTKATYNLPLDRQAMVREMAEAEEVGQKDIVEAAIVALYNAWKAEQVDLKALRAPTRSAKVLWQLAVPDEFQLSSD